MPGLPTDAGLYAVVLQETDVEEMSLTNDELPSANEGDALEAKRRLAVIVDSIADGFYVIDRDWRFTHVNDAALRHFRMSREELVGHKLLEVFPSLAGGTAEDNFQRAMQTGESVHFDAGSILADRVMETHAYPSAEGLTVLFRDLTERNRLAAALKEAHERAAWLARFPEENPSPVLRVSADGSIAYLNPVARELPGWSCEMGKYPPEQLRSLVQQAMACGEEVQEHVALADKVYLISVAPIVADGYANVYGHDITDRIKAEAALRQSETRYRALFENSIDAIFLTAPDGRVFAANQAACKTFGMTEQEIVRAGRQGVTDWSDPRHHAALEERARSGQIRRELRYVRKDGTSFTAEVSSIILPDQATSFVILRDITERKAAENVLQNTLKRFYAVLSSMYSAVLLVTDGGCVEFANPAFCRYFGLDEAPADLIGLGANDMIEKIKRAYVDPDRALVRIQEILDQGQPVKAEEVAMQSGRTCLRDYVPLDIQGESYGRLWIHVDITARKQAEEELKQSDRRKNEFLAVLLHELRNPLSPITTSLFVLEHAVPGGEQANRAKAVIARQVGQLRRLVDDLLDVTRITRGKFRLQRARFDLVQTVSRTADDYRVIFVDAGIAFDLRTRAQPIWIDGDEARMSQAIGNLLTNSAKFTTQGGKVGLELEADPSDGNAVIRIMDTGAGIAPSILPKLFEPFVQAEESLDRSQGGLGLGLALVKGIVEMHGGIVEAHSKGPGTGAQFVVRLPTELAEPAAALQGGTSTRPQPRRVLVIEDNVDTADALRDALEFGDHQVAVAYTGPEGIQKAHEFKPEVVLCDIGLPGMDGYEVACVLRADETLKNTFLVALSGYALPEDLQRATLAGFHRHLAKPPSLEMIEELLENLPTANTPP